MHSKCHIYCGRLECILFFSGKILTFILRKCNIINTSCSFDYYLLRIYKTYFMFFFSVLCIILFIENIIET